MWVLLFILLTPVPGFERDTVLHHYTTYAACQAEQVRITAEMAKAYEGDETYRLDCRMVNDA